MFYVSYRDEHEAVVLASPVIDKVIISAMFTAFLMIGAILFVCRGKSC